MVERIKEIILKEGLTSGSFADMIGVQRSSMSHIINGRNNPSLDFIVKTLQNFPKLNPEWLLNGVGSMYRSDSAAQPAPSPRDRSIFDTIPEVQAKIAPPEPGPVVNQTLVPEPKLVEKQVDTPKNLERYVDKVMIFYSDHTYDEFLKAQNREI